MWSLTLFVISNGMFVVGCIFGMAAFYGQFLPMHAFAFLLVAGIARLFRE